MSDNNSSSSSSLITPINNANSPKPPQKSPNSPIYAILQVTTVLTLLQGYMGVYCAFSLISVISPLLLSSHTLTPSQLGTLISISRTSRILPKFLSGFVVDLLGGKGMFVLGSTCAGLSATLFGFSGLFGAMAPTHSIKSLFFIWYIVCNCAMQISTVLGWGAVIKSAGRWFSYNSLGKAMSILALSYLFGDGIARSYLSFCIYLGFEWQSIAMIAGGTLLFTGFIVLVVLRGSPQECGYPEPEADPSNVLGKEGNDATLMKWNSSLSVGQNFANVGKVYVPILTLPLFWFALLWYTILTMVRYVFLDWWTLYLTEHLHAAPSFAAFTSMIFPFAGGFGSILFGIFSDRLRPYPLFQYGSMVISQLILMVLLLVLWLVHTFVDATYFYHASVLEYLPLLVLVFFIGVCTIAPYSLSSLISLRIGGKKLCSSVANLFDGAAAIASVVSGLVGGSLLSKYQDGAWSILFIIGIVSNVLSILCLVAIMVNVEWQERRSLQKSHLKGAQSTNEFIQALEKEFDGPEEDAGELESGKR